MGAFSLPPSRENSLQLRTPTNKTGGLCVALPCFILLRFALSYFTLLFLALPRTCRAYTMWGSRACQTSYRTLPCFALLCLALPCCGLLCPTLPCFALLCLALPCFASLCLAVPCFALLLLTASQLDFKCKISSCFFLLCLVELISHFNSSLPVWLSLLCLALPCFALLCLALPCIALHCLALTCFSLL